MKISNLARIAPAALAIATSLFLSQSSASAQSSNPASSPVGTITGVWSVTRHGVNCQTGQEVSTFPALMTFHADGTVSGQAYAPGSTNAYGPMEHGVWQHAPGGAFAFKLLSYAYTASGGYNGYTVVIGAGQLMGADQFTYETTIQIFDASGKLLATHCGRASANRFR